MPNDSSLSPLVLRVTTTNVSNQDGSLAQMRAGRSGALMVADSDPRYYDPVNRGITFAAAGQAAVTLGAGLSATSVWSLYNPAGSGVNLALVEFTFAFSAAPAAAAVVFLTAPGAIAQAAPTALTALTTWQSAKYGTALLSSQARVYTAATLAAAPVVTRILGSVVAASSITPPTLGGDIAGAIVIPPGAHVTLQASAAASGFPSMTWTEIPV